MKKLKKSAFLYFLHLFFSLSDTKTHRFMSIHDKYYYTGIRKPSNRKSPFRK